MFSIQLNESFQWTQIKIKLKAIIHHSHILKLAFLSEITIFTGEARQGAWSDCAVSLSKPQIWRTNVSWPALICSLVPWQLFQRIAEHKLSSIGKHLKEEHSLQPANLQDQFTVLKECRTKFDCLIYEMLFIRSIKSKLNTIQFNLHQTFYITIEYFNTFSIPYIFSHY